MPASLEVNRVVSRNLCHAMGAYAGSSVAGRRIDQPGLTIVDSGLDYAAFNAAILSEPLPAADLVDRMSDAARYFHASRRPWGCWVCDDLVAPSARAGIAECANKLKIRLSAEHQGMISERLLPAARPEPDIEYRAADTRETQADFAAVCAEVFGLPRSVARAVYGSERFWTAGLRGWVGYSRKQPVSIASVGVAAGVIGLYSVGTLPSFRHRGIGEAITRHVVREGSPAGERLRVVLQSTPAGLSLYRRIGFEPVTRVTVYMSA